MGYGLLLGNDYPFQQQRYTLI